MSIMVYTPLIRPLQIPEQLFTLATLDYVGLHLLIPLNRLLSKEDASGSTQLQWFCSSQTLINIEQPSNYNKINITCMQPDPYNWPFPQRTDTMALSTINNRDFSTGKQFLRESSFQFRDIKGITPTQLIPQNVNKTSYNLSTYIEPTNNQYKNIQKTSDPLNIKDIEGAHPKAVGFQTKRVVDPLQPVYQLPSTNPISIDKGRSFLRDTLKVDDIVEKKSKHFIRERGVQIINSTVPGSQSVPRTRQINNVNRLQVKDINTDGIFQTKRSTNPLQPTYNWRDDKDFNLNNKYGSIDGNHAANKHPVEVNRRNDLSLNIKDIEGAQHNSVFDRSYFLDKRREIRNYMKTEDIDKTNASSLKKGITTIRTTDPLVPRYKYPGHSQIKS